MTVLKFKGKINTDDWNLKSENRYSIGGRDIVHEIYYTFNKPPFKDVYVALSDDRFSGDLDCVEAMEGYSEYTPGNVEQLFVGPHNLLDILERLNTKEITLWIADEPINTLEDDTREV